jgi:hypothetical protein
MSILNFGIKSSRQRNNEIFKDGKSTEGLTKEQKYDIRFCDQWK